MSSGSSDEVISGQASPEAASGDPGKATGGDSGLEAEVTTAPRTVFRLHPTVNFARVGTSDQFYLSPETSAGLPVNDDPRDQTVGGLPIRRGTESEPISSDDLRDASGRLLRQAARFRLFAYDFTAPDQYPAGGGTEIVPGCTLPDGRLVADIVWTVHLANKKAAAYAVVPSAGLNAYAGGQVPQLRNPQVYGDVNTQLRIGSLMIDPGPRAIRTGRSQAASSDSGSAAAAGARSGSHQEGDQVVACDRATIPSYCDSAGQIQQLPQYPVQFPQDTNSQLFQPSGPLDSLGELRTDDQGRLLVLAATGKTAAQYDEYGDPMPLTGDLNNAGWFDDAADGPVSATVVFADGSTEAAFGAWVICGDPAYAPQIRNVVSVWDDVYDAWIRNLELQPEICQGGVFQPDYRPSFPNQIFPVFRAAAMQRWTANLPELAVQAHRAVESISATDDPARTIMSGLAYVRNPNLAGELSVGVPLMPLSLGEAGTDFLAVSKTQYFFLEQWDGNVFEPGAGAMLGAGEYLDMASLSNCLGGRYVPGIEVSYPIRQPDIYLTDWRTTGAGPFRVKHKSLAYETATKTSPFLTGGWIPLHGMDDGLEPGDLSKFMSIPWQTDYNSCSIHQPSINTSGANTATGNPLSLYWSWPSQRPDAVYPATAVVGGVLPPRVWSIRGPGTLTNDPKTAATFQKALQSVQQWDRIGVILQGTAILGDDYPPDFFLEAESQLPTEGQSVNVVAEWPFHANPSAPLS